MGLVRGIGVYEKGKYSSRENGKRGWGYHRWANMLTRCYDPNFSMKNPTYAGCSVDPVFLNFQNFMLWAEKQVGFNRKGFQLDKDILCKDNKVYTPEVCVFVPSQVNTVLINSGASRGRLPLGVHFNTRIEKYIAQLFVDNKLEYLGMFSCPKQAFKVYKDAKESNIKRVANKYKSDIDSRVYDALMTYEVTENV